MRVSVMLIVAALAATPLAGCFGTGGGSTTAGATLEESSLPTGAARFTLEGIEATPEDVQIGGEVVVRTTLVNVGDAEGVAVVLPAWDGDVVKGTRQVTLAAGAREPLEFTFEAGEAGRHAVSVRIIGEAPIQAFVNVLAPEVTVTDVRTEESVCADYLEFALTVTNGGGAAAGDGYALDVYSTNHEGATMGHETFALEGLAAGASTDVAGRIFAPVDCQDPGPYTLTLIVTRDGVEEWRHVTEPFAVATGV